ncbi:Uma2 family endonuclease [Kribbella sp. NPDC003505]|uniref:Uma2 family endonuclease n=1 Tax=Kribbella sp. NPDC003505 TaxID=3154448 RepID=UPI0033A0F094
MRCHRRPTTRCHRPDAEPRTTSHRRRPSRRRWASLRTGWIEPDLVVLRESVRQQTWIEAEQVLCPIEIISPSSFHRDRIDKPAICAGQGMPYYLHVEIRPNDVLIELLHLHGGEYVLQAQARSGQIFQASEPFAFSFDPAELLEPR